MTSVINGDGVGLGLLRGDLGRDPRSGGEVHAIAASLARSLHLAPTLHRGQVGEKEKQVKKLQKALRQIEVLKLKQNQGVQESPYE